MYLALYKLVLVYVIYVEICTIFGQKGTFLCGFLLPNTDPHKTIFFDQTRVIYYYQATGK